MASKLVGLLIVAAVLGVLGHQPEFEAREVYGNDNWIQAEATHRIVTELLPGVDFTPNVDRETYMNYLRMVQCFNGTITLIEEKLAKRSGDVREDLIYKFCHENQKHLLDAYMGVFTYLTGSAIAVPVHFLKDFQLFVERKHLDASQVEKNLPLYTGIWQFRNKNFYHKEYCERMIELFDVEIARWDYIGQEEAIEFLNRRTMMPVGEALNLCRKRIQF